MGKFDGYYVKVTDKNNSVAVIFGKNKSKKTRSSFIQVITADKAYNTVFDYSEFMVTKKPFSVTIGKNRFDEKGMTLNIEEPKIEANLTFTDFTPIRYDAMGFFRFFPFMECKHRVLCMNHEAAGSITINDEKMKFKNAKGYIEGDKGKSFPKRYFWSQCNLFAEEKNLSIMASVARIPYLSLRFTGNICIIHYNGKEYRLATYRGSRAKVFTENKLVVKQGRKLLEIDVLDTEKNRHDLYAPNRGKMDRFIKETVITTVRYKFTIGKKVIFDVTSDNAAYEYSSVNQTLG